MKKYIMDDSNRNIISTNDKKHAGSKARRDMEYFLSDAIPIYSKSISTKKMKKLWTVFKIKYIVNKSLVYVQYPLYMRDLYKTILYKGQKKRGIAIIHDLDCLRYKNRIKEIKKEIYFLNQFSGIIAHNEKMIAWLKEQGCTVPMTSLELFDYYTKTNIIEVENLEIKLPYKVSFAGNLSKEKSEFIYKIKNLDNKNILWNLFGINYEDAVSDNIVYKGSFDPDNIPDDLCNSHFGLVWDGDSIKTCQGDIGEYQRYNNPHKCSLYLAAGIPVIVWEDAAIATFVKENNVGICIKSLEELDSILARLKESEYILLKKNAIELSKKVRSGYFIHNAIKQISNWKK